MRKIAIILYIGIWAAISIAQNKVLLNADSAKTQISRHIYGHFAEHISRVIYDGIYVGEKNAKIPNTDGVRNDVIKALKDLKIKFFVCKYKTIAYDRANLRAFLFLTIRV